MFSEERAKCPLLPASQPALHPQPLLFHPVSSFVLSVLLLSDSFLDLWELPLVVVLVGSGVRVMQPRDYSMGQIESDRLKLLKAEDTFLQRWLEEKIHLIFRIRS